ncbi:MAG TPA: ester cyclase [candidate division Zixibacteria bacterium]|nr:ester cyclase [candidate division Zixibacteria bacterium]
MSEKNKEVVRRIIDECFNNGNFKNLSQYFAKNYTFSEPTVPEGKGAEGFQKLVSQYRIAFPDLNLTIERQFEDGDTVITLWRSTGTHRGELFGALPTGKYCTSHGVMISRMDNGKIIEGRQEWDVLGLMRQIGAIPMTIKTAA